MLIFAYYDAIKLKGLLLGKRSNKLMEVASILENKLPTSFNNILISENAVKLSKKEQVQILNRHLQPIVDKVAQTCPGYGLGFYSRKLDCIVAVGPKFNPNLLGKTVSNPPKLKLYETGKFQIGYVQGFTWIDNPTIMALNHPIYYNGQLIGHSWANTKTEDINRDFYLALFQSSLIILLIWLIIIGIIWWLFKKLQINLSNLSSQISQHQDSLDGFKDFPELLPVLQTVTSLRNQLRDEIVQCKNETQKLSQIIDLCPLYIIVVDSQGKIATINKVYIDFLKTLGMKEDIVGKPYRIISDLMSLKYEETAIFKVLRGTETLSYYPVLGQSRFSVNAVPIKDSETGEIRGAIAISHDITEYEKMKEEISKIDRLSLIAQMAAGVAHEIRNPMTAVRGYLQLVMKKLGKKYDNYFNIIIEELDRANLIINDFLSLAKNKPAEKKQRSLNDIIINLYPLIYGETVKKGINIKLNLSKDVLLMNLNEKEIKQLILNFTRNSIEAMEEKGILTIETKNLNGKIQLIIADTGCGIPKENLGKIFNPFYTNKDNGTGLGLAVCSGIIERHQGSIEVQSQEGVGTTFTITFNLWEK